MAEELEPLWLTAILLRVQEAFGCYISLHSARSARRLPVTSMGRTDLRCQGQMQGVRGGGASVSTSSKGANARSAAKRRMSQCQPGWKNEEPGKLQEAANITNDIGLMVQKNSLFFRYLY
jgi:hypothetical protein